MKKTNIREHAFKMLYSMEIQKEWSEEQIEIYFENNDITDEQAKNSIKELVEGTIQNKDTLFNLIKGCLKSEWDIERISKINLTLLKLSIYEMLYVKTGYKIVINEIIELAKTYGEEPSAPFVNGVLASIVKKEGLAESKEE